MEQEIAVQDEFMTLTQVLKEIGIIPSGGAAKFFLQETEVRVNGEPENRRGKKLYPGDTIWIDGFGELRLTNAD
ncbi:S4 domain-containing protein YaaA [Alkalicoccus chagannorensis]|uniref:S4 domain-containing protein YaaA n=1 Tax=Alkalicoccus chagannorensis TaxID=427072 RepID=UPI00041FEA7A|nr:S4 domain-containing protein YaaA [Alkalicoccus chagannorensis]